MKELSIEEKAKELDASLERAKKLIETCDSTAVIGWCEYIFPELIESKDERIRQQLLYMVKEEKEVMNNHLGVRGMSYDDMIAWLEKQGKRLTTIDIDKMVYKYGNTKEDCTNGLPVNCQIRAYRQGINDTLNLVSNLEKQGKYETIWKPTKEQINALTHFVRSVGESGYASPYDNNTKLLYSLLHDLEQLERQGEQNYEFHGIAESRPAKGKLKELCQELSQSKVTKKSDQDWSEEDERNLKGIIDEIETNKNDAPDYDLATYDRFLFWLKSLKQRMQ